MTAKQKNILIKELQEERRELLEKINCLRLRLFLDNLYPTDETKEYVETDYAEMYWVLEAQFKAMVQYKATLSELIGIVVKVMRRTKQCIFMKSYALRNYILGAIL